MLLVISLGLVFVGLLVIYCAGIFAIQKVESPRTQAQLAVDGLLVGMMGGGGLALITMACFVLNYAYGGK